MSFVLFLTVLSPFRATQIKTYSWDNAQVILVGNKCDMEEERVVPTEKGQLLAEQLGMCLTWMRTCACVLGSGTEGTLGCVIIVNYVPMSSMQIVLYLCDIQMGFVLLNFGLLLFIICKYFVILNI